MTGVGGDELLGSVVSAADVATRLAALEERFGSFPLRETGGENAPERFASGVEMALDGWRGDAGALVRDVDGRVLLVRHAAAPDRWGTPGGGHEPGEDLAATARREVREETGVDPALTDVHEAVRTEVCHEADADRTFTMLTVHFDGLVGAAEPELDVSDDEILEARWFESPPDADALCDHCREWVREALADFDASAATTARGVDRIARGTERFVDARLDALREAYGEFPVRVERERAVDDAQVRDWLEVARGPERVAGAYALVYRPGDDAPDVSASMPDEYEYDQPRALLAMGRAEDEWTVPGGGVEPGERFEAAAEREVREETGVDCDVRGIHHAIRGVGERDADGPDVHFLYVVFNATYAGGHVDVQESELNGACWFRVPPTPRHWLVEDALAEWFDALGIVGADEPDPENAPDAPDAPEAPDARRDRE